MRSARAFLAASARRLTHLLLLYPLSQEKEAVTFSFEEKKEAPVEAAAPVAEAPAAPAAPPPAPAGPGFFELMSFNGRPETVRSVVLHVTLKGEKGAWELAPS